MYDVVTIGDCVCDIFLKPCSDHFCDSQIGLIKDKLYLRHGDKISIEEAYRDIGGGAANVSVGLSRLGLNSAVIGAIGVDQESDRIKDRLDQESVDHQWLKSYKSITTSFSVIIVYGGERTIFVYRGLKDYSKIKIGKSLSARWIYLAPVASEFASNYSPLISLASEKNIRLAVNPSQQQIKEGKVDLLRLLRVTTILILNKQEAVDLTESSGYQEEKKLLMLLKNYGPQIIVITNGKNGAYVTDGEKYLHISKFESEVIDSTGAGDAFSSGFLAGYIYQENLEKAMKWGIVNSAQVIEKFGAQTNLQKKPSLEKLVAYAPKLYKL